MAVPLKHIIKRQASTMPAIAFDATGVIYRGSQPLPFAKEAFKKLQKHNVPFCVLTNAGGSLEKVRAERFNKYLGLECFNEQNMVQANTPMRSIIKEKMTEDDQTLSVVTGALGIHEVVDNAVGPKGGFKYLTVEEMCILYPYLVPLTHKAEQFKTSKDVVRGRVSERFQMDDLDSILYDNKIEDVFIMS